MELTTEKLLQDLLELTKENFNAVESLKKETLETLNWKQDEASWSVLECVEHLNRYGDFYIPELTSKISASKHKSAHLFKSNWLGKYFSMSVAYSDDLKKMNTFKSMNPINSKLTLETLDKFTNQQEQIIELLNQSKNVNLDKTKTAISISKLVKLRLGDTFRVLIYHNERHIKQAEKVMANYVKR